ncbi:MAG: hypothetical protein ACFFKA_21215, partial [Candidatus Thorarchaeota archaeon]
MEKCKECKKEFKNLNGLSNHLSKTHKIKYKDYYDFYYKIEGEGVCPVCGKEPHFRSDTKYKKFCSNKCTQRFYYGNKENKEKMILKIKKAKKEKYGD